MRRSPLAAPLALAATLLACGPEDPVEDAAEAAVASDAIDATVTEGRIFLHVLRAVDEPTPDAAATGRGVLRARDQLAALYGSCVSLRADAEQGRLSATFTRCRSAEGSPVMTGTVDYTFAPSPAGLTVQASARQFALGPATVETLDATATLRLAGGLREVTVTASRHAYRGGLGRFVESSLAAPAATLRGDLTSGCFSYDGGRRVTTREVDGREGGYTLRITGYQRCLMQCPRAAMDAVVLTSLDGARVLRGSFSGLATGRWVYTVHGVRAAAGTWRLNCG